MEADSPPGARAQPQAGADRTRPRIIAFPKAGNAYTECLYSEVEQNGVEVIDGIWSGRWLLRNLRRGDLVHVHWPSFLYFHADSQARTWMGLARLFGFFLFARLRGARLVWTAHNLFPHDGGKELLPHRLGRRVTTLFANSICVHGDAAGEILERELGIEQARLRVGHHGHWVGHYPNEVSRDDSRRRLNVRPEEFVYLFVGLCKPYKGLEVLIEAFTHAPRPARLVIAGKFPSEQYLLQIASLVQATPGVELVPYFIPDRELQCYLNASDCVVLPYRSILTSGAAMLALSFGRPVVAPDLGAMRDHVDADCGLLYPAHEPQGLAQAMQQVRTRQFDPAAIMARARRFTWKHLAALLLDDLGG